MEVWLWFRYLQSTNPPHQTSHGQIRKFIGADPASSTTHGLIQHSHTTPVPIFAHSTKNTAILDNRETLLTLEPSIRLPTF